MGTRGSQVHDFRSLIRFITELIDALDRRVSRLVDELIDRINAIPQHTHDDETDESPTVIDRPYILVAASDTSAELIDIADYVCDGVNDVTTIINADGEAYATGKYILFTWGYFHLGLIDNGSGVGYAPLASWTGWSPSVIFDPFGDEMAVASPIERTIFYLSPTENLSSCLEILFAENMAFVLMDTAFTVDTIVGFSGITSSYLRSCVVASVDSTQVNSSFIALSQFSTNEWGRLETVKVGSFWSIEGASAGPVSTVPAVLCNVSGAHITSLKVMRFDAPAVVLEGELNGNNISGITHLLGGASPTFTHVVFDNDASQNNAINCASIFSDKMVSDGVLASNVCGDPEGGPPIVI